MSRSKPKNSTNLILKENNESGFTKEDRKLLMAVNESVQNLTDVRIYVLNLMKVKTN